MLSHLIQNLLHCYDWIISSCVSCLGRFNLSSRVFCSLVFHLKHGFTLLGDWFKLFLVFGFCFKWFGLFMLFQVVSDDVSLLRMSLDVFFFICLGCFVTF